MSSFSTNDGHWSIWTFVKGEIWTLSWRSWRLVVFRDHGGHLLVHAVRPHGSVHVHAEVVLPAVGESVAVYVDRGRWRLEVCSARSRRRGRTWSWRCWSRWSVSAPHRFHAAFFENWLMLILNFPLRHLLFLRRGWTRGRRGTRLEGVKVVGHLARHLPSWSDISMSRGHRSTQDFVSSLPLSLSADEVRSDLVAADAEEAKDEDEGDDDEDDEGDLSQEGHCPHFFGF